MLLTLESHQIHIDGVVFSIQTYMEQRVNDGKHVIDHAIWSFSICWHPMVLWHTVRHTMPVLRNRFPPRCRDIGAELFPRHPLWTSLEVLWHIFRATGSWRLLGSKLFIWSVLQQRLGRVEKLQTDFVFAFFSQNVASFCEQHSEQCEQHSYRFWLWAAILLRSVRRQMCSLFFSLFSWNTLWNWELLADHQALATMDACFSPPRYTTIHEMSGDFHRGQKLRLRGAFAKSFGGFL